MKKKRKPSSLAEELGVDLEHTDRSEESVSLSEDELAMLTSALKKERQSRGKLPPLDQSEKAQAVRFVKRNKLFSLSALIALICAVAVLISGAFFGITAILQHAREHADYTIILKDIGVTKKDGVLKEYTADYKSMMRDGILYIDLMPMRDYFGLILSGSDHKKKFTAPGNTYLEFEHGSDSAVVNGEAVLLGGKAEVSADVCFIPLEFLRRAISRGFVLHLDEDTHTVTVNQQYYATAQTQKVELMFDSTPFPSADLPYTPDQTQPPRLTYTYPLDLTGYLDYMYAEKLLLVNKTSENLGQAYDDEIADDLVNLASLTGCATAKDRIYYLQTDAAYSLAAMMQAMALESPQAAETYVTSAYRSYQYQYDLFYNRYMKDEAAKHPDATAEELEEIIETYSARPGQSEHQTGLCLDFTATSIGGQIDESFEDTPAFAWLSENAYKYGFILRYPEDKVDITGYQYEPWHYRFVGIKAAAEMHENGLCLEEYLASAES